jgi:histidinol-phosphate phosphatase family protein
VSGATPAVFLDKDGTLLDDVPYNVDPAAMRLAHGARKALGVLGRLGAPLFVISNQSGVALGRFAPSALVAVERRLRDLVEEAGAMLTGVYWCPHHPSGNVAPYNGGCNCRKPAPGMLLQAAREHGLDLAESWFVGDILDDVEAGRRAGCKTVLIDNGNETVWHRTPLREPHVIAADLHEAALAVCHGWNATATNHETTR